MDYEKKYNEALERAKYYHDRDNIQFLENIFPELKESEDERIRKELIQYVKNWKAQGNNRGCVFHTWTSDEKECDEILDWLKKQGEQKSKIKPKWLYRLEYKDNSCGLWYNGDGKWCFEFGIGSLDDSCKTKSLPMDYDERYKQDGRDWFSSCTNKEDLLHWYSKEDAKILMSKGFVFTRYLATEYHEYEQQTVFIKETSLYREEIDFFSLFENQKPAEWSEEDRRNLNWVINVWNRLRRGGDAQTTPSQMENLENFLKSLKDRYAWKPSDEQIGALEHFVRSITESGFASPYDNNTKSVYSLLNDLKKLK